MRGRLINPFFADIAQLDVAATAADPGSGGPLTSGYDTDFKETVVVPDGTWRGYDARRERLVRVPCQVEIQGFGTLEELLTGNSPRSRLVLVFHFADLERMRLVDPTTGEALLRVNDRLVAIREMHTAKLVQAIQTPPGLYITEAQPQFAMGRRRNLLLCTFEERALGSKGTA
jgi:hypothetical protein